MTHDPLAIGGAGSLRFPGYHTYGITQAAPWLAVQRAPDVDLDPSRPRGAGVAQRPPVTAPARDASGPAVFAQVAYPNVKGLSFGPALAFEVQRLSQQDDGAAGDPVAAARAYGAPMARLTGFLGLLEPLDIRA